MRTATCLDWQRAVQYAASLTVAHWETPPSVSSEREKVAARSAGDMRGAAAAGVRRHALHGALLPHADRVVLGRDLRAGHPAAARLLVAPARLRRGAVGFGAVGGAPAGSDSACELGGVGECQGPGVTVASLNLRVTGVQAVRCGNER